MYSVMDEFQKKTFVAHLLTSNQINSESSELSTVVVLFESESNGELRISKNDDRPVCGERGGGANDANTDDDDDDDDGKPTTTLPLIKSET
ncbi:hypothetical protein DERF_009937 [Dermatophagoides farinae]|uniref:Uncharacterized protein n=1 Tax=Dermatophagoides farinae TaxID=6954 RepID=A0A922L6A3_DERFA|nr:hypothetical protein DERF_009937 [Dermatophagoides farinae]